MSSAIVANEKGLYYNIILNILGSNESLQDSVKYIYKNQIQGIYDAIPHYFEKNHIVRKDEFIFSMRWALGDLFGDGCEVDEPADLFKDIA